MDSQEFRNLLAQRSDLELLGPCLREEIIPYAFDPNPSTWSAFRAELALGLGVAEADIVIIGSARLGLSMKPRAKLRKFSDQSDIDVVVVNSSLFDRIWVDLLHAVYPRPPLTDRLGGWLNARRKELYTGWILPLEIHVDKKIVGPRAQPILDIQANWFSTFKKVSRHPPRRHEDVTGRLYRTWEHAELYHLHSISALRRDLVA
jgi:hypothetical protein